MSNYKRFVSYVYEYDGNTKKANRGFLKVECRAGNCQIQFSLRGLCGDGSSRADIYGFRRKGALLEGSHLKTIPVEDGMISVTLTLPEQEMGEAGYSMAELAGIILQCEGGNLYATQWDDDPLDFQGFPNISGQPLQDAPSIPSHADDSVQTELQNTPVSSESTEPQNPLSSREESMPLDAQAPPEHPQPSSSRSSANEPSSEIPDTPEEDDVQATCAGRNCGQEHPDFCDGSVIRCRRLTPRELNQLHPSDRHLSSNRFLHYGYQSFGHILVGQLAESGQTILCVPGTYHQQECMMARMFGFPDFIRCPRRGQTARPFGYWYRSIHPADFHQGDGPA